MKKKNLIGVLLLCLTFLKFNLFSQTVIDDFTDGNFTSNQVWTGSTSSFSIITDAILPNGNASTDGSYLASNASEGDVSLAFPSTEVSEWRFSLGSPDFNPSGSNYIGVVLMANAAFSGDLVNDNTNDFQGYYLRIGDSGTDSISLYRKTGSGETKIGDFSLSPSFTTGALRDGINIRVTRSSSGIWELFYSVGFDNSSIPMTSAGTLTNNTYSTSSYFGVYQNINTTSTTRRVYIDNIELGTVTWDGSESNDWATAANWDTNAIPTSTDNLIIPSGLTNYPTVTTAETINSLIVSSDATLVANNAGFTVTNNAIYTRNLAQGSQWYLMSSPVNGENYNNTWVTDNSIPSSTQDTDNRGISWYDNSSSDTDSDPGGTNDSATGFWRYMEAGDDNPFAVGRGYGIIRSTTGDVSFVGSGIYTSDQSFTLTQGVNNFNLIGNPFTGFITLGTFHSTNSAVIGTTLYTWNSSTSSYVSRVSNIPDSNNQNFEIAPGQGFFVEASSDSNVTFEISDVTHQGTDTFQKTANEIPQIKLNITEANNSRFARIYYINGTTTGYDNGYEGKLFGGVSHSFAIYSNLVDNSNNEKYQLQSLPDSNYENMVIPIGVIASSGKEITFTTESTNLPLGIKVFLEDRESNTFVRLDEANTEYKITLSGVLNGSGRFYLHTRSNALSTDDLALQGVSIYSSSKNTLRVNGVNSNKVNLKIYNILGKNVFNQSFTSRGNSDITLPNLSKGIYVVKLATEKGEISKKIVLE